MSTEVDELNFFGLYCDSLTSTIVLLKVLQRIWRIKLQIKIK